jgi:hypothetical protein
MNLSRPTVSGVSAVSTPDALAMIADKVRRLAPSHRDPKQFHIDKSEIEADLRRLATGGRHG